MATKNVKSKVQSKVKSKAKSKAKSTAKKAVKSSAGKKLIAAAVIIVVLILIAAIVFISMKGLWGDLANFVKSFLGSDSAPSGDGAPSGEISSGEISSGDMTGGGGSSGETSSGDITGGGGSSGETSSGDVTGGDGSSNGNNSSGGAAKPPAGTALLEGDVLEMRVLDIGQGDCILLIFPDGQIMVMDIGSEFGTTSPWNVINGALTELDVTAIDYLFLSHTDYDHIREAKKLIDNYDIKNFYFPKEVTGTTATWANAVAAARAETYVDENGITQQAVYNENVGYYEISGENWIMKCYTYDEEDYPTKTTAEYKNAVSPICLLEYADRTIVLTGDSNYTNENYLLNEKGYFKNIDADILKVAHHGSTTSTSQEFLNRVDCEYAIISCGAGNPYNHPTPDLMDRLASYVDVTPDDDFNGFIEIYRTDEDGTITVQIDENGVINVISEKTESKNATTGTPIEIEGEEISGEEVVAFVFTGKRDYNYYGIAA